MTAEVFTQFASGLVDAIVALVAAAITAIAGLIGAEAKKVYEKKVNTQVEREIAEQVVLAVEQTCKAMTGSEKLEKALEDLSARLELKGISVTELEMRSLIESAVASFNDAFYSGSSKESNKLTNEEEKILDVTDKPIDWTEGEVEEVIEVSPSDPHTTEEEVLYTDPEVEVNG